MLVLRVLLHLALGVACFLAGVAALNGEAISRYLACALLVAAVGYVTEALATLAYDSR